MTKNTELIEPELFYKSIVVMLKANYNDKERAILEANGVVSSLPKELTLEDIEEHLMRYCDESKEAFWTHYGWLHYKYENAEEFI